MEQIIADFVPHRNAYGLMWPEGKISQNDVCGTAYYVIALLKNLKFIPDEEQQRLTKALNQYIKPDGLTLRTPVSLELESNDNLVAWGLLSSVLHPGWATLILGFGRRNGWIYPDTHGGIGRRWLGRHRALEAHFMIASRLEKPDFITQGFWILSVLHSCFRPKTDQDNYSLSKSLCFTAQHAALMGHCPLPMLAASLLWELVWKVRGVTLATNLESYGWKDTPWVKWL
jgi:hypothetical protein